jgi:hypothetical protein
MRLKEMVRNSIEVYFAMVANVEYQGFVPLGFHVLRASLRTNPGLATSDIFDHQRRPVI